MNVENVTLGDVAESVTSATLPEFFQQLANRPEPQTAEFENLLLDTVANTIGVSVEDLKSEFLKYKKPQVAKRSMLPDLAGAVISELDFLKMEIKQRQRIIYPWLKQGDLAMVSAPRGIGKTWLVHVLLAAITRKQSIGSWKTENPVNCLLLDGEMSAEDLQARFQRLTKNLPESVMRLDIISADLMHQKGFPTPNLANEECRKSLFQLLKKSDYGVVVIDNSASLSPGLDENSKQDYDPVNQLYLSIRFLGIAVILIHHSGKDAKKTAQRGTSSHEDALDTSIVLKQPPGYKQTDGCRFIVEFTKARSVCGDGIKPFIFSLDDHEDGSISWRVESKSFDSNAVIALLGNGTPQKEIPGMLHIDKAIVSRIKTKAEDDGLIEKEKRGLCKFTPKGQRQLGDYNISSFLS